MGTRFAQRILIGALIIGCARADQIEPVSCNTTPLLDQIESLKEKIKELEDQCNPVLANYRNCPQDVLDRWFDGIQYITKDDWY